jgi:hypothetical protein
VRSDELDPGAALAELLRETVADRIGLARRGFDLDELAQQLERIHRSI